MTLKAIHWNAIGRSALRRNARSPLIACIAVALLAALACGRYGPPRRVENLPTAAPAAAVPVDPALPLDGTDMQPVEPDLEP